MVGRIKKNEKKQMDGWMEKNINMDGWMDRKNKKMDGWMDKK